MFSVCVINGQEIIKCLDIDVAGGGYQVQVMSCRMFELVRAVKPVEFCWRVVEQAGNAIAGVKAVYLVKAGISLIYLEDVMERVGWLDKLKGMIQSRFDSALLRLANLRSW